MHAVLHLQLDPHSGIPAYRQMMDQIRYYIAGGTLRPGDQLPSIRELATAVAVNPTTVVRVYTELERDGILEMRHGKGAFVSDVSVETLAPADREKAVRRAARQLALESSQLRVSPVRVVQIVREELAGIEHPDLPAVDEPVKFTVMSGG
jgi:GntR family transcriptional regulator